MTIEDLSCPTCMFFERLSKTGGLCHRFPRVLVSATITDTPSTNGTPSRLIWNYPYVRDLDWCGEHEIEPKG